MLVFTSVLFLHEKIKSGINTDYIDASRRVRSGNALSKGSLFQG